MSFLERFIKNYHVEVKKYPVYLNTINKINTINDQCIDILILKKYPKAQRAIYKVFGQHIPYFYFGKKYIYSQTNLFDKPFSDLKIKKSTSTDNKKGFFQKLYNFIFKPQIEFSINHVENKIIRDIFKYRAYNTEIKQLYQRLLQLKNLYSYEIFDLKSIVKNNNIIKSTFQLDIFARDVIMQYACELFYDRQKEKIIEFLFNRQ